MNNIKAEIITIGDELLLGQVIDTNSAYISQRLFENGIKVSKRTAVQDDAKEIKMTIDLAFQNADIIILTGGLGPTKDDLTKNTLCEYFNTELEFRQEVFEVLEKFFLERGKQVSAENRAQAFQPKSCISLPNVRGTAPGMMFEKNGKVLVSLPGVPHEMKGIFEEHFLPYLIKKYGFRSLYYKTVLTQGIPESVLMKKIEQWEYSLAPNIKLAYLPSPGMVRLRLTQAENLENPKEAIAQKIEELKEIIGDDIFGYDEDTLEGNLLKILKSKNWKLATAESCTGGYIAHKITSVPGSSEVFQGSVVAYHNEIKVRNLGVKPDTLQKFGAVSRETVLEMVEGVKRTLQTDCAIATSGIAGPGGGSLEKPVGLVWVAVSTPEATHTRSFCFGHDRGRNIHQSCISALNMLRKAILNLDVYSEVVAE